MTADRRSVRRLVLLTNYQTTTMAKKGKGKGRWVTTHDGYTEPKWVPDKEPRKPMEFATAYEKFTALCDRLGAEKVFAILTWGEKEMVPKPCKRCGHQFDPLRPSHRNCAKCVIEIIMSPDDEQNAKVSHGDSENRS